MDEIEKRTVSINICRRSCIDAAEARKRDVAVQ